MRRRAGDDWVNRVTLVAVLAPLVYSASRLLWALGLPVGITEDGLDAIGLPGLMSIYVLWLAAAAESVGLLTHHFMHRDRRALPSFVPLLGARTVPTGAVIVPAALVAAFLLSMAFAAQSPLKPFIDPDEFRRSVAPEDWGPAWSFWGQQVLFLVWGLSLAIATIAYWLRARGGRTRDPEPQRDYRTALE